MCVYILFIVTAFKTSLVCFHLWGGRDVLGVFWGWRVIKYKCMCLFIVHCCRCCIFFPLTDQTSCPCCGDSVWSALDDECLWFTFMLFHIFLYMKQNVKYQVVFFCHLYHMLQNSTSLTCRPLPYPILPAHEVHLQCTTRNEGSLHASMKFNLRWEWMTEKSCRLWFILMKLNFKSALHARAC